MCPGQISVSSNLYQFFSSTEAICFNILISPIKREITKKYGWADPNQNHGFVKKNVALHTEGFQEFANLWDTKIQSFLKENNKSRKQPCQVYLTDIHPFLQVFYLIFFREK